MSIRDAVAAFFYTLNKAKREEADTQKTRPSVAGVISKRPIGKTNVDTLRRWAQTNEWIRTAIDLRRSQVSSNDWDIVPIDPRAPFDQEMQAQILALFMMPNLRLDSFRTLIEPSIEDLLVLDAGCLEVVRNVRGVPSRLYNVDGGTIRIDPTWDGTDENLPRYHWFPRGIWKRGLANDDLVYMMTRPASYRVVGLSTLEILQSTIEADLMAAEYNKGLVTRAAPSGILNLGEDVQPDQVDAFRAYYEAEVAGRAATAIMGGAKAVQWLGFGQNNREMQFMAWQGYLVRKIAAVFGCAAQDLGITSDQNRSTAEVQQEISEDRGLRPLMLLVEEYLNREIVGSFVRYSAKKKLYAGEIDMPTYRKSIALSLLNARDPRTLRLYNLWEEANLGNLHFNYKIGTGRARREIREDIKTYLNQLPIWTINEARAELNLDPIEGGDQILIPTNLGPVKLDDFISGKATVTPGAPGQPGMTAGQEKALLDLDTGRPVVIDTRRLRGPSPKVGRGKPRSPTHAQREQDLAIRVGKWFRDYARIAPLEKWARAAVAEETKTPSPELLALINQFADTAAGQGLQASLNELLNAASLTNYNLGGQLALDMMGIDASFNLTNQAVIDGLAEHAGLMVTGIDETTRERLAGVLSDGVAAGQGVDALATEMRSRLSDWASINEGSRARLIANTEVASAMSVASHESYRQNGLDKMEWETSGDQQVCPECEGNSADGSIDIMDSFSSGDSEPPAHPDCRCALLPVIPDEWQPPVDCGGGTETASIDDLLTKEEGDTPDCAWTGGDEEALPAYEMPTFDPPLYEYTANEKAAQEFAAKSWGDASGRIQDASKLLLEKPTAAAIPYVSDIRMGYAKDAAHLLNAVAESSIRSAALYRGMYLTEAEASALLKTVDQIALMPLSSFTSKKSVAQFFTSTNAPNWTVLMRAENVHGYSISRFVASEYRHEAEWIVAGRYQVMSITSDPIARAIEVVIRGV